MNQKMTEEERKELHEQLQQQYEHTFDMDNLPKVAHRWVDRGLFLSCEGAGHPNHRHHKQRASRIEPSQNS